MEETTHLAWILVASESLWRIVHYAEGESKDYNTSLNVLFCLSYVLCIVAVLMDFKDISFFKSDTVRDLISTMHAMDGVNALLIGLGLYYHNIMLTTVGLLLMTKLFLLHLLSRMVTGVKTYDKWSVVVQTTKTFLHHIGSFLFIASTDYNVIVITTIWRFISMNGHAAMTLRKRISAQTYDRLMWAVAHLRNLALATVLFLCVTYPSIRSGFGK